MEKREIKFRAWDTSNELMVYNPFMFQLENSEYMYYDEYRDYEDGIKRPCELMQYTGLKDKNGVEIYEGDVVQHSAWNYPFEIIFDNDKARFVCKLKTGLTQYIDYKNLVVVGNIHQHPHLLNP